MLRKLFIVSLLATFTLGTGTSCIGRMALNKKLLNWNLEQTEGKWGRWGIFLILNIIPVYPIASLIDLLVINSIEFHSGTNPVSNEERLALGGESHRIEASDGTAAVSTLREDGSIDITIIETDGTEHFVNVQRTGDGTVVRNAEGAELGSVSDEGQFALTALGERVAETTRAQAEARR